MPFHASKNYYITVTPTNKINRIPSKLKKWKQKKKHQLQ